MKDANGEGEFGNKTKSYVPEGIQDWIIFILWGPLKHKILSFVVQNMAKYTIILLVLIDFVPIFFIFNLFRKNFRGSFRFKKIPSSKKSQVDFKCRVGQPTQPIKSNSGWDRVLFSLWLPADKRWHGQVSCENDDFFVHFKHIKLTIYWF